MERHNASSCRTFRRFHDPDRIGHLTWLCAGQEPHRVCRGFDEERARRHRRCLYRQNRHQDRRKLCRKFGTSKTDRTGRAGGYIPVRRHRLDGLRNGQEDHQRVDARQSARQQHRADRAEGLGDRQCRDRTGLRSGKTRRRRQDCHRRREGGSGRQIRQGGAGKARRMAGRGAEIRDGGERARGADPGGARRSRARDRLFDRCQGRARRQDRRHLPGGFSPRHHLSRCGNGDCEAGSGRLSRVPALVGSQGNLREIWLQTSGEPNDLSGVLELSPTEWTAIQLSLRVAAVATLVATPLGIAIAWLLARRDFWGKAVVDALIHLPLVLPPVATGYLLLLTFGRRGLVGAWLADHLGIVFAFRWTGAALACGIMSFPLLVRPIRLSIEAVDRRLEQAAGTLGAAPWRVFATVTLPLALPGVLAGMVLGFAKAIGEFGATITFVSNIPGETQTISSAIYSLIQTPDGDSAALRLVAVSVVIAMAALVASEWFARRATQRLHGN